MLKNTNQTPIEYVGKKEGGVRDTVAGTGTFWSEPGDIQLVANHAVPKLLRHPDVWAEAELDEEEAAATTGTGLQSSAPVTQQVITPEIQSDAVKDAQEAERLRREAADAEIARLEEEERKRLEQEEEDKLRNAPPQVDLASMNGEQMRAYAEEHFQHKFHHKMSDENVRNGIIAMMNRQD